MQREDKWLGSTKCAQICGKFASAVFLEAFYSAKILRSIKRNLQKIAVFVASTSEGSSTKMLREKKLHRNRNYDSFVASDEFMT